METLNLGILAHVDAGKTTLTERLLYEAGAIDAIGSVDEGTTQTDSLALERQRGITIRAAVVAFTVDDTTVNIIDTPGHPDFIAEVERSLSVLDAAVLVVSAVEGVQAQTVVLMRALQRLRVPALLFVNKIDRPGADPERVLAAVRERLTREAVPMGAVVRAGDPTAEFVPDQRDDELWPALVDETAAARMHPTYFGSAMRGAGIDDVDGGHQHIPACRVAAMRPARPRAPCSRSSGASAARSSPTSGCSPVQYGCGSDCTSARTERARSPQ